MIHSKLPMAVAHFSWFKWIILRPPLCLLVFLFAASIGIVCIHIYALLRLKFQLYIAIAISVGIVGAFVWLFLAHRESKSIKRKLHAQYIIQQNMKNQVYRCSWGRIHNFAISCVLWKTQRISCRTHNCRNHGICPSLAVLGKLDLSERQWI